MRHSPLDARHRAAGARMVPFGGWEMPVTYPLGTIAEHLACRQSCVVFDVSHLGTVRLEVRGDAAVERLQAVLTNDLRRIGPGRTQYSHLLEDDGSVLDDLIVWWHDDGVIDVMPNASNTDGVVAALGGSDVTDARVVLAVQGPSTPDVLAAVWPEAATVRRNRVVRLEWRGYTCAVAGTGYTGERGVEIAAPVEVAGELWDALLAGGAAPAGLGARDTLRLEACYPLHGNELGPGITPLQAGLGWVVGWDKPVFRGRAALLREREAGPHRLLRAISSSGRRPPRAGCPVNDAEGTALGVTTSGNFSPVLEHGIALAWCPPHSKIGDDVTIDVRGSLLDGVIVEQPFVRGSLHSGG